MPLGQLILLAVVQGLTEFLPVSSTAHLYLCSWLLKWKPEGLDFDIALHLGTLLAVTIYFLGDWIQIFAQAFGTHAGHNEQIAQNPEMLWLLALGSIPVGAAGLAFQKQAEAAWRSPYVMSLMLVAVGVLLGFADRTGRGLRDLGSLHLPDAIVVGASQVLALVPGTSRSGITITAGLFRDFSAESAARFSFLLSTPVIAAAAGKTVYQLHQKGRLGSMVNRTFWLALAVSAITGYAAITWFLQYLRHGGLAPFAYYRVIFGIIVFALAFFRRPAG